MPACWACNSKIDLTEHHVRAKRHGGSDGKENLCTLCRDCHEVVEQPKHLSMTQITRMDNFPRLQTLALARILGDIHDAIQLPRTEDHVIEEVGKLATVAHASAIALHDLKMAEKLKNANLILNSLKRARRG